MLIVSMPYYWWAALAIGLTSLVWLRVVVHDTAALANSRLNVDTVGNITLTTGQEQFFTDCVEARAYGAWLVHLRLRIRGRLRNVVLLAWSDQEAHRLLRKRIRNDNLTMPLMAETAERQGHRHKAGVASIKE